MQVWEGKCGFHLIGLIRAHSSPLWLSTQHHASLAHHKRGSALLTLNRNNFWETNLFSLQAWHFFFDDTSFFKASASHRNIGLQHSEFFHPESL